MLRIIERLYPYSSFVLFLEQTVRKIKPQLIQQF
jgi:hypothetical protein